MVAFQEVKFNLTLKESKSTLVIAIFASMLVSAWFHLSNKINYGTHASLRLRVYIVLTWNATLLVLLFLNILIHLSPVYSTVLADYLTAEVQGLAYSNMNLTNLKTAVYAFKIFALNSVKWAWFKMWETSLHWSV